MRSAPPLLTIAIPTYNRPRFLAELLVSLKDSFQELTPAQQSAVVIAVRDNASPYDAQGLVTDILGGLPVIFTRNQENIGGDRNFLACIETSSTPYIWLLGDDELLLPQTLKVVLNTLTETRPALLLLPDGNFPYVGSEERMFADYKQFLDEVIVSNPYGILAHSLISTNIFRRDQFNLAVAHDCLSSHYAHMYGLVPFLVGPVFVASNTNPLLVVRKERPPFSDKIVDLERKQAQYLVDMASTFGRPRLADFARHWIRNRKRDASRRQVERLFQLPLTLAKDVTKGFLAAGLHCTFLLWGALLSFGVQKSKETVLVTGLPGFGGGPFTFLKILLLQLQGRYRVVCSFRDEEIRPELVGFCREHGIELISRPNSGRWGDLAAFSSITRKVRPLVTVVNVGTFSQCFHLLALPLPILYYSHSIWHHPLPRKDAIFLPFFRYYRNHRIFTVSAAAKDSLDQVYFYRHPASSSVSWLHNGIVDRSAEQESRFDEALVLTLGSVAWYKNPQLWQRVARRVISQFPDGSVRFVWAGQGELQESLSAGNDGRVEFVGQVANPDPLLASCAVYFQPSQFESFGLGVCEAMMFGKPVVASKVGALPELIVDGVDGYLVSLDREDLMVTRLVALLTDRALAQALGVSARHRYLADFTEGHWSQAFWRLWRMHFDH